MRRQLVATLGFAEADLATSTWWRQVETACRNGRGRDRRVCKRRWPPQWHADYYTAAYAQYTGILYLGPMPGEDEALGEAASSGGAASGGAASTSAAGARGRALEGGWTALIDAREDNDADDANHQGSHDDAADPPPVVALVRRDNGTFLLRRGLVVAPRRGRLLFFSGGGENYHAALPVFRGRRRSLVAFFACACQQSAARSSARSARGVAKEEL